MVTPFDSLPPLPPRPPDSHKGSCGRVLVVAGSIGLTGAAYLCAQAALRSGAGMVVLQVPRSIYPILATQLTCVIVEPLPETPEGQLRADGLSQILARLEKFDALSLGPGLSEGVESARLVDTLLHRVPKPIILDADGLNILSSNLAILRGGRFPRILTPHPGEMARLCRKTTDQVQANREMIAVDFAREYRVVTVLKGHRTVVADGERLYVNTTGNPGMATAGSGDVLTGALSALVAAGMAPFEAAVLAVYVHGLAGDNAAQIVGLTGMTAEDILNALPQAFRTLEAVPAATERT